MDVQLAGDVAERRRVQFVDGTAYRLGQGADQLSGPHHLFHQGRALFDRQVVQLDRALDARQQDQPGKAGVVLQPDLAQGPVGGEDGSGLEGGVSGEISHVRCSSSNQRRR
ncbi:hypothetical protein D3C85_1651140 [compost metagenome]